MRSIVLCALVGCVPSTKDLTPTGAGGFVLEPSTATRGEPFTTADGYTIVFESVVVLGEVSLTPPAADAVEVSEQTLFSAASTEPIYAPGAPAGSVEARFLFTDLLLGREADQLPVVQASVAAYLPRFQQVPQVGLQYTSVPTVGPTFRYGPSLYFAFHADGQGRHYVASFTLGAPFSSPLSPTPSVTVPANDVGTTPLQVHAERLFVADDDTCQSVYGCAPSGTPAAAPLFTDFAEADVNGDGAIEPDELQAATGSHGRLASDLMLRAAAIFTVP